MKDLFQPFVTMLWQCEKLIISETAAFKHDTMATVFFEKRGENIFCSNLQCSLFSCFMCIYGKYLLLIPVAEGGLATRWESQDLEESTITEVPNECHAKSGTAWKPKAQRTQQWQQQTLEIRSEIRNTERWTVTLKPNQNSSNLKQDSNNLCLMVGQGKHRNCRKWSTHWDYKASGTRHNTWN